MAITINGQSISPAEQDILRALAERNGEHIPDEGNTDFSSAQVSALLDADEDGMPTPADLDIFMSSCSGEQLGQVIQGIAYHSLFNRLWLENLTHYEVLPDPEPESNTSSGSDCFDNMLQGALDTLTIIQDTGL